MSKYQLPVFLLFPLFLTILDKRAVDEPHGTHPTFIQLRLPPSQWKTTGMAGTPIVRRENYDRVFVESRLF